MGDNFDNTEQRSPGGLEINDKIEEILNPKQPAPSQQQVEEQLKRILTSEPFGGGTSSRKAPAVTKLFAYLVLGRLPGKPLDDEHLAVDCFKRPLGRHAEADLKLVRQTMHNVRERLEEYNATAGLNDLVVISLPKGNQNRPVFTFNVRTDANKAVRRGLRLVDKEGPHNLAHAIEEFEKAIRLERTYAEGYAGKAMALTTLTLHGYSTVPGASLSEAEGAAREALRLSEKSWRGHAALGAIHAFRREWKLADSEFIEALRIDWNGTCDHGAYGVYLLARGRYADLHKLIHKYSGEYEEDVTFAGRCALYSYLMREYDAAERYLLGNLQMNENLWLIHLMLALVYMACNRVPEALLHVRLIAPLSGADLWPGLHILCLARAGYEDDANNRWSEFEEMSKKQYVPCLQLALAQMAVSEPLKAIHWLRRAANEFDPFMTWLHLWPILDPLRQYDEFKTLIGELRLPAGVLAASS